jgi:ATP-dependent RNA circularization protein (DNA/RNA ligase family)
MKRVCAYVISIAAILVINSAGFSQMFDDGPGFYHPGDDHWGMRFYHHRMMSPELRAIVDKLNLETTIETFRVNVEKVRLDAAEKKIPLKEKARVTLANLKELFKKYQSDKTVSKDIVQALKDLNGTRIAIRQINKDSFTKIRTLKEGLDSDIDKAVDLYIQKISGGGSELDELAKHFNSWKYDRCRLHMEQ